MIEMVKILSVHHFLNEDVQPLDKGSSSTICAAYDNLLLVAGEHRIDVYDLKNGSLIKHSFPTIDYVLQIVYSRIGNYVCTLEKKLEEEDDEQTYLRVYFRWDAYSEEKPMKARIAGMVSPRGENDSEILEMLEVPTTQMVGSIAACKKTGNLCMSSGASIHVFRFSEKTSPASRLNYYDFDHFLKTDICFEIGQIAIAESIIGCLCATEVLVFEFVMSPNINSEEIDKTVLPLEGKPKSLNEELIDDCKESIANAHEELSLDENSNENSIQTDEIKDSDSTSTANRIDEFMNMEEMRWVATLNGSGGNNTGHYLLYPSLIGGDCNCRQFGRNAAIVNNPKPVVTSNQLNTGTNSQLFTQVTLLHKTLKGMAHCVGPFSNLEIIQYFDKNTAIAPESVRDHPLMDSSDDTFRPRKGTTIFFTSLMDGIFLHICEDRQVMSEASYVFTADIISVSLESHILHVMTKTGLESYMIRPHPCILDPVNGSCIGVPLSFNSSVNVIGLRPFRNVQSIALTKDFLAVIFNDIKEGESELSLCSLKLQSPTELFSEVVRVASNHPDLSPTNSLVLLMEGYLALVTAAASVGSSALTNYGVHIKHACELVAKYYLREDYVEFWKEAVRFFLMTASKLSDFVKGLSDDIPGKEFFLKEILLRKDTPTLDRNEAEEIIAICFAILPNSVADILLHSKCLSEYRGTRVLECIGNEADIKHVKEMVTVLFTSVNSISKDQILEFIDRVGMQELISTLEENINVLLKIEDDKIELTDLSKFMVKHKTEVFNEIVSDYTGKKRLNLDSVTTAFTNSFPIYSCDVECNANYIKLRDFVELYFKKYGHLVQQLAKDGYEQSISMMISLYIASLMGAFKNEKFYVKSSCRTQYADIYGIRQPYLDLLPPFNGEIASVCAADCNTPSVGVTDKCHCRSCSVDLLLLQSLLLSTFPSEDDRNTVVIFAKNNISYPFSNALLTIAEENNKINAMVKQYPTALLQYMKDTCKSTTEWKKSIQETLAVVDEMDQEKSPLLKGIVHDVLFEAATLMPLEDFVDSLPAEKYEACKLEIDLCHRCSLANYLKEFMDKFSNAFLNANETSLA